ncbi:hypothetical protein BOW51_00040 [Solemya velesiana gill symbiont]|uniref:Uncharacterized protein n=2 Tax=Solemya velesiana gill symbiont TaxID=1918948 RepID=A0A1T2KYJ5_9GAMM|nr:hypothetical protein BOW51_00040 [Solemya velesiana gill symbiont]
MYLDNMELELGKKYKNNNYEINASLYDAQYTELKTKHNISNNEFADVYSDFQKMRPTKHLKQVMDAFTASGGHAEVEPIYDENTERLSVSINFVIKDKTLEKIEGLSPIEVIMVKMDAMLQIDAVLSGADPDISPSF